MLLDGKTEVRTTGVALGKLGFGGAAIGNLFAEVSDREAADAVKTAFDKGIRHFDTAPCYGYGLSEVRLGATLAELPRSEFTISTKVGYVLDKNLEREVGSVFAGTLPDVGVSFDYSRDGVHRSLEASLDRLGLSHVDIVLLHDLDPTIHPCSDVLGHYRDVALTEGWPALCELRQSGDVRAIGFGLNHADTAHKLLLKTDPDVILLAGRYTLLDHLDALPFLAACANRNVAVMVGGPFNSGILAVGSRGAGMYDYAAPILHP